MKYIPISIIIPVYNEEKYISDCLTSVYNQDYPYDLMEVIVIDGNSTDKTASIIEDDFPKVKILHNPDKIVPISMNMGIDQANGDYIIRLDAHAKYPANYVSSLIKAAILLNSDNVGAVCFTDVKSISPKSIAIKTVLAHKFGVGNSLFRTGINKTIEVDTVPFGCFRKDVFERFGQYDERLIRNQDIELNKRIKKGGGKIYLIPDTYCTYFARETYKAYTKSNFGNGLWNILTVYYTQNWSSLSLRHYIPLIFILSLIIPLLSSFIFPPLALLSILSILVYLIVVFFTIIKIFQKEKGHSMKHLFFSFVLLHFPYGWGSMIGIFRVLIMSLKTTNDEN